mmetsp:Transcript_15000/g.14870  ORF Transcript_15000/g.14870 Transcript_15000/m.14870 type:complete len:141 (-) Transcript_15000:49-471(-)|eukprot:CAMPEP_0197008920 /NCGR_PEP_ID=MMETSP1380-20130617/47475_1 /TAXON_ID=5936 /ORGANISM="Euplotes crassus, Strain CT5" /LENGTH=140 /DNA_ID=CAMNT_0042429791 /DNA_START=596 /DNA_END=1021 /DNA_ORIENTATION=+
MQKVIYSLRGNLRDKELYHSNSMKKLQKKESFDIISKAREACDQYLKHLDSKSSERESIEKLLNSNDIEESKQLRTTPIRGNLIPYLGQANTIPNRKVRYQDYLMNNEPSSSSGRKSYLDLDHISGSLEDQQVRQGEQEP